MKKAVFLGSALTVALAVHAPGEAASCSVSLPSQLDFGSYDTVRPLTPAGWSYSVTCTRTRPGNSPDVVLVSESFSVGSGSYEARTLSSGRDELHYNLYASAGHTQVLGDGTAGTVKHGPTALSLTRDVPVQTVQRLVYGRVPGNQDVAPGIYRTTVPIVVTIEY